MYNFIIAFSVLCLSITSAFADLNQLEERAQKELQYLNFPPCQDWVLPRITSKGENIYDVIIVGGGQTGMTIAFALLREKISNIVIFDECDAYQEGPWLTHARMETLRTPKYTIGPDCDIPSLTVRAWFEAKYGEKKWEELNFIPRLDWAEYLHWLRKFLNLPMLNNTRIGAIEWSEQESCFVVPCKHKDNSLRTVYARKIVLATGLQGSGEWFIPEHIKENIPRNLYYHTSDDIDFSAFKNTKVGILGGGPCAFDNAYLCSQYADEVHMFFKKPKLVNLHVFLWGEFVGFQHFTALPDDSKWQFISKMYEIGQPPTPQSVEAVRSKKNIFMHFDSSWEDSKIVNGKPIVITPKGEFSMDVLMTATGWMTNLNLREELKEFKDKIALWSDKFIPPEDKKYEVLLRAPYLTKGFCFTEKIPGTAPYLNSIFNCTGGALVSTGFSAGTGISGMRYSIKTLVNELVSQLFVEDRDFFYHTLENYDQYLFDN
ncbi:MAG: NAD(P)/FAD-dependent oxidoreductase [Candidatus Rhabdochlamydia sp.]